MGNGIMTFYASSFLQSPRSIFSFELNTGDHVRVLTPEFDIERVYESLQVQFGSAVISVVRVIPD